MFVLKKSVIFPVVTLLICLVILIGAFVTLPKLSLAASQNKAISKATKATISLSPSSLPNSQCVLLTPYTSDGIIYQSCLVTVTLDQSVPKGLRWSSSYTSKSCFYNSCSSANNQFSIFHGSGTLFKQGDTAQVFIICPAYNGSWYHGYLSATFVFSGSANLVKVNYYISGGD